MTHPQKQSSKQGATAPDVDPQQVTEARPSRAWQRMLSGRRLDLLNPSPADIEIEDIAHGLARVARWNGQTVGAHAFSVAQHALIVEDIACALPAPDGMIWGSRWQLAALLHDAAEYVVGDLISPFKTAIGLDYKAFELRLLDAIHARFGLGDELPSTVQLHIKHADRVAAYYEATRLAGFSVDEALLYFGTPEGLDPNLATTLSQLEPVAANVAEETFLARFGNLIEHL